MHRAPTAGFEKMTFLGVAKPQGSAERFHGQIVDEIRRCGQFQKVNKLNRVFKIPEGDKDAVAKSVKADVEKFQDSRYVHGVMVTNTKDKKIDKKTEAVTLVMLKDRLDHRWVDSHGTAATPGHGLYGIEEVSPMTVASTQRVVLKTTTIKVGLRYLLLNRELNQVILDKQTFVSGSVASYTQKPLLNANNLEAKLDQSLARRVVRAACPKLTAVTRKLYAENSDTKADELVVQGIELAGDERWEDAANMWRKAVLIDRKHGYAYHNLGVYYERAGNLPSAMEEYQKEKRSRLKGPNPAQYDASLKIVRPLFNHSQIEPRIYTVSGANWVTIQTETKQGASARLKAGREYPVYRSRRQAGDKLGEFNGTNLIEVGRVSIVKAEPPFMLARVTQYLQEYGIEAGDFIGLPQ